MSARFSANQQRRQQRKSMSSPTKHHSQEADDLDFLCRKMSDVRVRTKPCVDEELRLCDVSMEQFQHMVADLKSGDLERQKRSLIQFRKLLAHEDIHPYLDRILECDTLPFFCSFLQHADHEIQFESAWVLTNIAAGTSEQTAAVVHSGSLPHLVELLKSSPSKVIREQAVWCLGNITGDGVAMRTAVLNEGALEPLLHLISDEMNAYLSWSTQAGETPNKSKLAGYPLSTLRIAIWALSNFCRGQSRSGELDWNLIEIAMPVLSQVITCCAPGTPHCDDEILMDACWALSRTLRGIHEGIEKTVVGLELCQKMSLLINYQNPDIQIPALRCLINIVSGNDAQTQVVVDAGLLDQIHQLLRHPPNSTVLKEACLIISNITAGTQSQVQSVLSAGLLPVLIDILRMADYKTRREACWALGNAFLNRVYDQVLPIVDMNALALMFHLLIDVQAHQHQTVHEERVVVKILEACRNVLICGEKYLELQQQQQDGTVSEMEQLLHKMSLGGGDATEPRVSDSAYSSAVDLFAKQHPFKALFYAPLAHHAQQTTGAGLIEQLASCRGGVSLGMFTPSCDVIDFARDVVARLQPTSI